MKRIPPRWYEINSLIVDIGTWEERGELYDKVMCKRWNVANLQELKDHLERLQKEEAEWEQFKMKRGGITPLAINHYRPPTKN